MDASVSGEGCWRNTSFTPFSLQDSDPVPEARGVPSRRRVHTRGPGGKGVDMLPDGPEPQRFPGKINVPEKCHAGDLRDLGPPLVILGDSGRSGASDSDLGDRRLCSDHV